MKPIRKRILAILLIFLVLSDDLVIQVKAKGDLSLQMLKKSPSLKKKTEKRLSLSDSDSHKPSQKNNKTHLSTRIRRLKETERRSLAEAQTKDFGITFLVLLGVLIVAGIYKYYLDKKVEKAMKLLNDEKNRLVINQYYMRIQEGSFNNNYCLTLQSLSKLFKSQLIMERINEEDLKGNLQENTVGQKLKPLKAAVEKYLQKLDKSEFPSFMTDDCYNTYKFRQGWKEAAASATPVDEETDLESIDEALKAADQSISQNVKEGVKDSVDWAFSEEVMENPKLYKEVKEGIAKNSPAEKDKIWEQKDDDWKGPEATDILVGLGSLFDNAKDFYEVYQYFTNKENAKEGSIMTKFFAVLKWILKKTHNVLRLTGYIQKISGADNAINFPFVSIGSNLANIIEKSILYWNAKKAFKAPPKNAENELNKDLAFYELVDECMDAVENIVTTCLRFLTPLTAGVSEIINMSIKILMKVVHIVIGHYKLSIINKLKDKIVEIYNQKIKEQNDAFKTFKAGLINRQCSRTLALVRSFVHKEFVEIEGKLTESQQFLKKQQEKQNLSDDEVNNIF